MGNQSNAIKIKNDTALKPMSHTNMKFCDSKRNHPGNSDTATIYHKIKCLLMDIAFGFVDIPRIFFLEPISMPSCL